MKGRVYNMIERLNIGEMITLDDDKEYAVMEVVEEGDKHYLYLVNEKEKEFLVAQEIIDNNEIYIENVLDENKKTEIIKIFLARVNKELNN